MIDFMLNGDPSVIAARNVELVVVGRTPANTLNLTAVVIMDHREFSFGLVAEDINNDGYPDVFARDSADDVWLSINPANPTCTGWGAPIKITATPTKTNSLHIIDANGDMIPDIATPGTADQFYFSRLSGSVTNFTRFGTLPGPAGFPLGSNTSGVSGAIVDIDGDGLDDWMYSFQSASGYLHVVASKTPNEGFTQFVVTNTSAASYALWQAEHGDLPMQAESSTGRVE